jgi:hypothetical protein
MGDDLIIKKFGFSLRSLQQLCAMQDLRCSMVLDYTNPILKPDAAEAVKKFGDSLVAGTVSPYLHNSCWPEPSLCHGASLRDADCAAGR